jgi:hypothetical protein
VLPDDRDLVGVGIGKRLEEERVDNAEDGGIRADADRQCGDSNQAEARRATQHANGVCEVFE